MPGVRGELAFGGPMRAVRAVFWNAADLPRLSVARQLVELTVDGFFNGNIFLGRGGDEAFFNVSKVLELRLQLASTADPIAGQQEAEGYSLSVADGDTNLVVLIEAPSVLGALRGLSTLAQLITFRSDGMSSDNLPYVPLVQLSGDAPVASYRGVSVDTVENFQPLDRLMSLLDWMMAAKLNVLKLQLSSDLGFRFAVPGWPLLQNASSSDFYSCADAMSLAQAATLRGVRIVPRFLLPNHVGSITDAYPALALMDSSGGDPLLDPGNPQALAFAVQVVSEASRCFMTSLVDIGATDLAVFQSSPSLVVFFRDLAKQASAKNIQLMASDELSSLLTASTPSYVIQMWSSSEALVPSVSVVKPEDVDLTVSQGLPSNVMGSELVFKSVIPAALYLQVFPVAHAFGDSLWSGGRFAASKMSRFVVQSAVSYKNPALSADVTLNFPRYLRFLLVSKSPDVPIFQQIPIISPELEGLFALRIDAPLRADLVARLNSFVAPLDTIAKTCHCSSWMMELAGVMRDRAAFYAARLAQGNDAVDCFSKDLGLVYDGLTTVLCERSAVIFTSTDAATSSPPVLAASTPAGPSLYLIVGVSVGAVVLVAAVMAVLLVRLRVVRAAESRGREVAAAAVAAAVAAIDDGAMASVSVGGVSDSSSESGDSLGGQESMEEVARRGDGALGESPEQQRQGLFFASAVRLNSSVSVNPDTESE
jgi:hypothetical protein